MDDSKRPPDIPANYVTLLQLQERWKQKQKQKQMHKDEQDNKPKQVQVQQLAQEQKQRNPQAQRLKGGRRIHRNSNGDLKKTDCHDCPVENDAVVLVVAVRGNESENFLTETKREGRGGKQKKKKKKKKKRRKKKEEEKQKEQEEEEKKKERKKEEDKAREYGEAREKRKEERIADDAQTPPVKSESNVPARRRYGMTDKRMEYRPKATSARTISGKVENVAEGTDATLKSKRKDETALEESEGPVAEAVEIEEKLRNLSVGKEKELLETQNSIVNSTNSYNIFNGRNNNRVVNRSNSQSGDYNRNFYGRNVENRVHNRCGVWPRGGQHRGNHGRFSGQYRGSYKGVGNGRRDMIWMKKEEIADNGEGAGDQSSGNSAGAI